MLFGAIESFERSLGLCLYIFSVTSEPLPLTLESLKSSPRKLDFLFECDEASPCFLIKAPRLFISRLKLIEE